MKRTKKHIEEKKYEIMEKTLYHIFSGADGILQCKCWKCRCERNSNYEKKCVIN